MSSYATPTDLRAKGAAAAALDGVPEVDLQGALDSASGIADGYLGARYKLPIVTASPDLVEAVCKIAAYNLLALRGYNPELGADVLIRDRYDDAVRWLERVADGKIAPDLLDSSTGGVEGIGGPFVLQPVVSQYDGTVVASRPMPRGW